MAAGDHGSEARAVYDASARRYVDFVGTEISAATEAPFERALLTDVAEALVAGDNHRIADVGCGPGRVAALLARHGLEVIGVDLALAMLVAGRRAHPHLRLAAGRLDELPVADRTLGGVVSWYSIIHTPPDQLPRAFAEIARVLDTGGLALLAFQSGGGGALRRTDAHGTGLPLTSYRHDLEGVAALLVMAGLDVRSAHERPPELDHESSPQAFVVALRP